MCEKPECYCLDVRKARKAHKCCECEGTIEAGEHYNCHHGIWDGTAMCFKVCLDCEALRDTIDKGVDYDDATPFEGLYSAVVDNICQPPAHFVELLRIMTKRKSKLRYWLLDAIENSLETRESEWWLKRSYSRTPDKEYYDHNELIRATLQAAENGVA